MSLRQLLLSLSRFITPESFMNFRRHVREKHWKEGREVPLSEVRIKSHLPHLNSMAFIEDYERQFIQTKLIKYVDESTRA